LRRATGRAIMRHAAPSSHRRPARHQHPKHLFSALAGWLKADGVTGPHGKCRLVAGNALGGIPEA